MTGSIIGNQNPLVGTTYTYEIKPSGLSFGLKGDYEWYLYKKQKNGIWKDITNKPKKGEKVTYRFGEIGLGIEFQMKVYEIKKGILPGMSATKELAGSCILIPTSDKVSKIEKVILFNRGAKDVNKASYRDTLIAQAHCIAMFNKEIEFHLWEDDAPGKGHDTNINKNNRHTRSYKARVNEKGIAEVPIPLMSDEKILRQMANQFLMKGDRNEGANNEYYVTATYSGKIQGASQVNVDVANPDYKGQPQNQPQPKSKPATQTPKFPTKQGGGPKQPDPKGNIIEALFIDDTGNELSKVAVGDKVRIRIHSKNMVGKHIQYVVWEYDTASNDEVFRSGNIKITADIHDTSGFIITKAIFEKGVDSPIGDPDSDKQNYFIEIISKDLSAESQKFGVNSEGLMQVEKVKSAAGVQNTQKPDKPGSCICQEQYKDLIWGGKVSCEFRKKVIEISKELWPNDHMNMANNLMAIMALETNKTFDPKTQNANGYFGLTGFGASTVEDFQRTLSKSITKEKILKSTGVEQLYYVKERFKFVQKYLMNNGKGGILSDFTDLYLAILYPTKSGLMKGEDSKQKIIFDASKGKVAELEYRQNPSFMKESNEWSTKQQVTFKRKGKEVTETLRGYKNLDNAKTYRWEVTEEIINYKNEGEKFKVKTYSCPKELVKDEPQKQKNGKWHDPVDNPMCTIFTQNQTDGVFNDAGKHWGLFGKTRGSSIHFGLDLFSKPGSPIYACVKCEVHKIITDGNVPKGYGKQIFLKVLDKEAFLAHYQKYSKLYSGLEYETIGSFSKENDIILHYAHLRKIYVKKGWIISNINVPIGETGVSGVIQGGKPNGTCAPHLHFEIRNLNKERINPGFFIQFKNFNTMSDAEKSLQQTTAKKGKIYEFNGNIDTYKNESDYE
ncbi:M23 family metallopeptidase [Chryseobacterium sediminis]|uniref:M23 family metallopeptidase n=1 Tax=Chryseobacterium sediminis TaxID=1679494 RepID=UPI002857DEBE|nr:M23 family metallopeptidase [Chryseobacterium sediminis]MDR6464969.1 murein DD-endopeptidase MepM/ murein hydrolase activator NlpD [Chryseobacterium sediminis]